MAGLIIEAFNSSLLISDIFCCSLVGTSISRALSEQATISVGMVAAAEWLLPFVPVSSLLGLLNPRTMTTPSTVV